VITNYKEIQLIPELLSHESQSLIRKTHSHLKQSHFSGKNSVRNDIDAKVPLQWLPCHAIDLHKSGKLSAHVDSIKFSGHIVAGLSLMSPSILRLKPAAPTEKCVEGEGHLDLFLPSRSLYVLSGPSRYLYTHEILPCGSTFQGEATLGEINETENIIVIRDRRISIIFRDNKV
jgi:alkylated DNA repair protein alkB family protein 7